MSFEQSPFYGPGPGAAILRTILAQDEEANRFTGLAINVLGVNGIMPTNYLSDMSALFITLQSQIYAQKARMSAQRATIRHLQEQLDTMSVALGRFSPHLIPPEHAMRCRSCQQVFDMRDLDQVEHHESFEHTPFVHHVVDMPPYPARVGVKKENQESPDGP